MLNSGIGVTTSRPPRRGADVDSAPSSTQRVVGIHRRIAAKIPRSPVGSCRISNRYSAVMSRKDHPNNAPGVPMVFPVWFENLQVKYLNSALKPIARFLPGTGTIEHRGRKSGKSYKTIVTA